MCYPLPWLTLLDAPRWCIWHTKRDCLPYLSSLSGCRFGRSGSSGIVVGFLRLQLSSRGLVPKVRVYRNALCQDWKFHAGYDLLHYMYPYHYLNCQDNDFYIRRRSSENHFIQTCKLEIYCNYFFMIIFFPVLFVER